MAILESVKKLASKVGADTNGRTIAEQINNINRHLSSTGSRDIAEAVSKFADKEDGTARLGTKTITENDTYIALDDELDGYSSVTVNVAAPTPETFDVTFTINEISIESEYILSESITSNKTYSEVYEAMNAGKQLNAIINCPEGYTATMTASYISHVKTNGEAFWIMVPFQLGVTSENYDFGVQLAWSSEAGIFAVLDVVL